MEYENLKDELLSAIDTGLKFARTIDGEAEFEIYLFFQNSAKANIKQGVVEATDGIVKGNAVRVAKQNCISFASSSGISPGRIRRSINEAVAGLRWVSIKDEQFEGFCEPKKPGKEGTFASEILDLGKEELIGYAKDLVKDGQEFDSRILMVEGSCSATWGGFAIGNTQGLQQASRSASNDCDLCCIAMNKEERRAGYEYDITRERLIKTEGMGENAARKAISLLGARKLNEVTVLPTIWEPIAAAAYVAASVAQSAGGHAVVEGRSPLAGKIGEEIANPNLTIIDDGQNPSSIMTEAIDAEGHPQQKNTLIEKGKLNQFMFDTYYAHIYGTESTGNCSRGGAHSTLPYEDSPGISPKSFEVLPGTKKMDDVINSIGGKAILIVGIPMGIFHSNVATGEFSAVAQSAFLIQDGEKKNPLQPVSVSGNFYKGFERLLELGSDLKKTPFSVETPGLLFDGFSIVG